MHTFIAHDKTNGLVHCGDFMDVIEWTRKRVMKVPCSIIIIIKCRPSEGGRVIAEIDKGSERTIKYGREFKNREILILYRRCANG